MGKKVTLAHCWQICKWKTVWRFLKILKIELPYDPEISLLGLYSKELKSGSQRDVCSPVYNSKTWKQPKCPPTDEWKKKMWYIYTMECYSAIKKSEIMPFATTWMDLEIIILSEVSQKEKDKHHMISLICGI